MYCDNQGAIVAANTLKISNRNKYWAIETLWLRDEIIRGSFETNYCNTHDMLADALTKVLSRSIFEKFREDIGIVCPSGRRSKGE
jgi:hypothetical protein